MWMNHPCQRPNAGGQLEHALNLDHLGCIALQCIGEQVKILLSHLHAGNCLVQRMFSCCPGFSGGRVIQDWWKVQRSTKATEYPELQHFSLFQATFFSGLQMQSQRERRGGASLAWAELSIFPFHLQLARQCTQFYFQARE